MKKFIAIIVLVLFLIAPSQADDIRDFQIEGISVGDNLLNFFDKNKIDSFPGNYYPNSKKFKMIDLSYEFSLQTYDDFYMIGFNAINRKEVWNGKLIKEPTLQVSKESHLICFDGNPIVNGKQLERFDYADLSPDRTYDINLNDGALGLFTECSV